MLRAAIYEHEAGKPGFAASQASTVLEELDEVVAALAADQESQVAPKLAKQA